MTINFAPIDERITVKLHLINQAWLRGINQQNMWTWSAFACRYLNRNKRSRLWNLVEVHKIAWLRDYRRVLLVLVDCKRELSFRAPQLHPSTLMDSAESFIHSLRRARPKRKKKARNKCTFSFMEGRVSQHWIWYLKVEKGGDRNESIKRKRRTFFWRTS